VPILEQAIAKMRTEEAGASRYQGAVTDHRVPVCANWF
jgi:hypothetical protein